MNLKIKASIIHHYAISTSLYYLPTVQYVSYFEFVGAKHEHALDIQPDELGANLKHFS